MDDGSVDAFEVRKFVSQNSLDSRFEYCNLGFRIRVMVWDSGFRSEGSRIWSNGL